MKIIFRDINPKMAIAWAEVFRNEPDVEISTGELFEVEADAVVSPANSFGFMNGGVDLIIEEKLKVEATLHELMYTFNFDELLVGEAVMVATKDPVYRYVVSAPTMRVPMDIQGTPNIYLAFKAAFSEVLNYNEITASEEDQIKTLLVPGMGTGTGRVDPITAAHQMWEAYKEVKADNGIHYQTISDAFRHHTAICRGVEIEYNETPLKEPAEEDKMFIPGTRKPDESNPENAGTGSEQGSST